MVKKKRLTIKPESYAVYCGRKKLSGKYANRKSARASLKYHKKQCR